MMRIAFAIVLFVVAAIIFFRIPYSKMKSRFEKDVQKHMGNTTTKSELLSEQDIALLPEPVQNHLRASGHIGKPKMTSLTAHMPSVPMKDPDIIVDFTLVLFADEPTRLAYIKSSIIGVPFEAYDEMQNGAGSMKGVIGKMITLFNETGSEMSKSQLLTYLGECVLIPSSMVSEHIKWEAVDGASVKATITCNGISGSGIFTFGDDGFMKSFYTYERGNDGKKKYHKWSAVYENYAERDGVYYPEEVKAIWHGDDGDLVYFHANKIERAFR